MLSPELGGFFVKVHPGPTTSRTYEMSFLPNQINFDKPMGDSATVGLYLATILHDQESGLADEFIADAIG